MGDLLPFLQSGKAQLAPPDYLKQLAERENLSFKALRAIIIVESGGRHSFDAHNRPWLLYAGLFSSQYSAVVSRNCLMSSPARHLAFLMFSCGPVRSRLYAKERKRAAMSGFLRMRDASSAKVASRT
jgi:hypothetical protein